MPWIRALPGLVTLLTLSTELGDVKTSERQDVVQVQSETKAKDGLQKLEWNF